MNLKNNLIVSLSLLTISVVDAKKKKTAKVVAKVENIGNKGVKEVKTAEKTIENLLEDFKINFVDEEAKKMAEKKKNSLEKKAKNKRNGKSGKKRTNRNGRPMNKREQKENNQKYEHRLLDLDKKIFGGGKDRRKRNQRRSGSNGPVYFKDSSVPVLFRKVVPPRSGQLPKLHFEYAEGNSICRCSCNLKG
jgi:hypothetical protein